MSERPQIGPEREPSRAIALLAGEGDSTSIVYHALAAQFPVTAVIIERPIPRRVFLRNRLRRLGAIEVAGQLAFQAGIVPVLRWLARERTAEILRDFSLRSDPIASELVRRVPSANADETIAELIQLRPRVVVVSGTRILSKSVLGCIDATFINMHAGITPLFRGVHGGYWALAEGQPEHCGVTIHVVDPGVDTGAVLGQARIEPAPTDNFTTYPLLQLAAGLPLLTCAVRDALDGRLLPIALPLGGSRQWYHPTAWGYLSLLRSQRVK